ncbi:hypothetical protein Btru_068401, partial [Bulinus truncatus]
MYCSKDTSICTTKYTDRDLQPVGCNETTMWTTTKKTKLACATSCSINKTCVAFRYVSQSKTCSICHGYMIESLNFTSGKPMSWIVLNSATSFPFNVVTNRTSFFMEVPNNISTGTV